MLKTNNATLVFLPGWNFKASIWQDIAASITAYKCILIDLPEYRENIDDIVDELKEKIPRNSILIAWSLGGLFAIYLCNKYPDFCQKLILVASSPKFVADPEWYGIDQSLLVDFVDQAKNNSSRLIKKFTNLIQYPNNSLQQTLNISMHLDNKVFHEKLNYLKLLFTLDLRDDYKNLKIPIYNIVGCKDIILPNEILNNLKNLNSNACSYLIEGSGHAPFIDKKYSFMRCLLNVLYDDYTNQIRRAFNKAEKTYDLQSDVQKQIGSKLIRMIKKICLESVNVIDLGCGSGFITESLAQAIKYNKFYAIDVADQLLVQAKSRLHAYGIECFELDFQALCFNNIFDLAYSNMALQWSYNLKDTLLQVSKILSKKGLLAFSIPLEGTFKELVTCSKNNFYNQNSIIDFLSELDFLEIEYVTGTYIKEYNSPLSAIKAIKAAGANYVSDKTIKTLNGKSFLKKLNNLSNSGEKFSLTYEIGFFIARKV